MWMLFPEITTNKDNYNPVQKLEPKVVFEARDNFSWVNNYLCMVGFTASWVDKFGKFKAS